MGTLDHGRTASASSDFFDRLAADAGRDTPAGEEPQPGSEAPSAQPWPAEARPTPSSRTSLELRRAAQELLRHGWLEQDTKPHLYKTVSTQTERINTLLEPLDLEAKVDDVRGLAFAQIRPDYQSDADVAEEDDDWSHPLVFRQRLTLEQSLLVAILRREFMQQEQEGGLGVVVRLAIDDLLPQLNVFIARSGSDSQDRKRLLQSLESLRRHGVVSDADAQDYIRIRPMIVHLANPENLQALLNNLQEMARNGSDAQASRDDEAPTEEGSAP